MSKYYSFLKAGFTIAQVEALKHLSATENAFLDGITPGTALASKALVLNSSKGISTITTATITNLNVGASGSAGTLTVFPSTALKGWLSVTKSANASSNTVTNINVADQSGTRVYTVPDAGASASFVMTQGAQTIVGATTFSGGVTAANMFATTAIQVGASGSQGAIQLFPTTASKGYVQIQTLDNAGNTITQVTFAAQAAARTYTVRDATADATIITAPTAAGAPGTRGGYQGMLYVNSSNGDLYVCTVAHATAATFKQVTIV